MKERKVAELVITFERVEDTRSEMLTKKEDREERKKALAREQSGQCSTRFELSF